MIKLTYKHTLQGLPWRMKLRFLCQRLRYGYDESIHWSLYYVFEQIIIDQLKNQMFSGMDEERKQEYEYIIKQIEKKTKINDCRNLEEISEYYKSGEWDKAKQLIMKWRDSFWI